MKIFAVGLALLAITTFATAANLPEAFRDKDVQTHLEDVDIGVEIPPDSPVVREQRLSCGIFVFEKKVVTSKYTVCVDGKCIGKGKKRINCKAVGILQPKPRVG